MAAIVLVLVATTLHPTSNGDTTGTVRLKITTGDVEHIATLRATQSEWRWEPRPEVETQNLRSAAPAVPALVHRAHQRATGAQTLIRTSATSGCSATRGMTHLHKSLDGGLPMVFASVARLGGSHATVVVSRCTGSRCQHAKPARRYARHRLEPGVGRFG
jgi:hypothetical protein